MNNEVMYPATGLWGHTPGLLSVNAQHLFYLTSPTHPSSTFPPRSAFRLFIKLKLHFYPAIFPPLLSHDLTLAQQLIIALIMEGDLWSIKKRRGGNMGRWRIVRGGRFGAEIKSPDRLVVEIIDASLINMIFFFPFTLKQFLPVECFSVVRSWFLIWLFLCHALAGSSLIRPVIFQ